MSEVGQGYNAAYERFFRVFRRERHHQRYRTLNEAHADVLDHIERFHNPRMRRRVAAQRSEVISCFKTVYRNGVEPKRSINLLLALSR